MNKALKDNIITHADIGGKIRSDKGQAGWNPMGKGGKEYQQIMDNIRLSKKVNDNKIIFNTEELDSVPEGKRRKYLSSKSAEPSVRGNKIVADPESMICFWPSILNRYKAGVYLSLGLQYSGGLSR